MSFIKNMFGGGKKPEAPNPAMQKKIQEERDELEKHKAKEKLTDMMNKNEEKIAKTNGEIDALETVGSG